MNRSSTRLVAGATAALLVLAVAVVGLAQEKIDRDLPASADATVFVSNISGSIKVVGWGEARVSVTGTLGKGTERLDFTSEDGGRRIDVKVILPKHARDLDGSDLEIRVPQNGRIEVETVSAGIEASGLTNAANLHSVSGEVVASGKLREIEAASVSGSVTLKVWAPTVRVESVSGDVDVEGARGDLEVSTVSGKIMLRSGEVDRLRCESVSGDLRFEGSLGSDSRVSLESHSGDITIVLPAKTNAEVEVSTFSGRIDNAFGQKAKRTSKYAPGSEMHFTAGDGGARLEVGTFSGDVDLITR